MAGPGDEIAAGAAGRSNLRASHADREQVIDVLKAAFVQGRLTKAELGLRVGQVLASLTYADLAALTADISAGPAGAQPLEPARESDKVPAPKTIACVAAAGTGASMVFTAAEVIESGGNPVIGLVVVGLTGFLAAVLIAGFLMLLSRVFEKSSSRHPSPGPPSPGSETAQRPASAAPAGQLPQVSHEPRHQTEACWVKPPHGLPRLACPGEPAWGRAGTALRQAPGLRRLRSAARQL
ncbi:MAG TPA: DUF1707 domain-containing protein, partial [Streptosporangiaceae bacterium]